MANKINTVVIYGDSISTTEYGNGGYEKMIKEKLSIKVIYNHAICGSALTNNCPDNLVDILNDNINIHNEADLIIIWHGTNDWYWGVEIGEMGTTDKSTFIGALETVIERLRKFCPMADIIYLTPLYRYQIPDQCENLAEAYVNKNIAGYTLKDYYQVIIEMSRKLCFTVVDMRTYTNFNFYNTQQYLPDYVHPSQKGYEKISNILCNHINLLKY